MGLPPGAMMPGGLHQRMGSGGGLPPMGLPPGMHGMPPGGPPPLLERVGSGAHPPGPGAQHRPTRHCINKHRGTPLTGCWFGHPLSSCRASGEICAAWSAS